VIKHWCFTVLAGAQLDIICPQCGYHIRLINGALSVVLQGNKDARHYSCGSGELPEYLVEQIERILDND